MLFYLELFLIITCILYYKFEVKNFNILEKEPIW